MVTIEAVPGPGLRAMAPVLEGVVVAIAGWVKVPLTISAAPNAIRTGQLSTLIASAEVASVVRADVLLWIPAKLAAVGEVHFSLPRGPGSEGLHGPGDAVDHFGRLYLLQHNGWHHNRPACLAACLLVSYCR